MASRPKHPWRRALRWGGPAQETNLILREDRWWAFATALLGIVLATLSVTNVATAAPTIVSELGGFKLYAWIFTSYVLAAAVSVPVVGKLSDDYGRRLFFLSSLGLFVAGSLLAGLAPSMLFLIGARSLMGLGGGAIMALALIAVGDIFTVQERGQWLGVVAAASGISGVSGPVIGGAITESLGWRWIFFSSALIGCANLVLAGVTLPRVRRRVGRQLDALGIALIAACLVPLLLALTWGGTAYAWDSWQELLLFGAAATFLALFVAVERRGANPLIGLDLFQNRAFTLSMLLTLLSAATIFGAITFTPLFLQGVLGQSPRFSGLLMMPVMFGTMVGSTLNGQLISRTGRYKPMVVTGSVLLVTSCLMLSRLTRDSSSRQVLAALAIGGVGGGIVSSTTFITAQAVFPHRLLGAASSVRALLQNVSQSIAVPALTTVILTIVSRDLPGRVPEPARGVLASRGVDPRSLVTPEAQERLQADFERLPNPSGIYDEFLNGFRGTLGHAMSRAYLIMSALSVLSLLVAIALPRVDLRATHAEDLAPQAGADAVPGT